MGSQGGAIEEHKSNSLPRQGSIYNLTLDEVQNHLGNLGKPLGSMNLDELLKSVCSAESSQPFSSAMDVEDADPSLPRQGSLTLPNDLSKKTVEEVWRDIQQNKNNVSNSHEPHRQSTLGEMTLEDLLIRAGVVTEPVPDSDHGGTALVQTMPQNAPFLQHQLIAVQQPQAFVPYHLSETQVAVSPSSLMGALSDTQTPGRKRIASGVVVEKTVERRQKRMIKNRESAARSRARKQAYTHELEIKVARLEEENERLRRQKEVEHVLPSVPLPEPKQQLRRTSSAPF